jgi:Flp pilus assembly protein TadD
LKSLGYLSGGAAHKERYTAADDPKNLVGVDREIHDSIDLYQRGDLLGAIASARRVVAERPMSIGYESLAFLLRQTAEPLQALSVYREAIARGAVTEELQAQYGLALCEAGRPGEAVGLLTPLAGSDQPETLNALGVAFADSGRGADAVRVFDRVLGLDPENVEAYGNLGIVRLRGDDLPGAREAFRKALAIDPRFPRAWNGLGVVLARLGQEREAIDSWSKAVALDPKLYDALFNLGLTAGKNGMRREARSALERFVATAPRAQYSADVEKAKQLLRALGAGS